MLSIDLPSSCQPCSTSSKKAFSYRKSSDAELKNFAFAIPRTKVMSCNPRLCKFGGTCVEKTTIEDMKYMMEQFWGVEDCKAPSTTTRRLLLLAILRTAYRPNESDFHFYAGCKNVNNRKVCEAAFLNLLGLMNSPNASDAPNQWRRLKEHVSSGNDSLGLQYGADNLKGKKKGENRVKFNSAVSFIEYFAKIFGDTIPDEHGKRLNIHISIICYLISHILILIR